MYTNDEHHSAHNQSLIQETPNSKKLKEPFTTHKGSAWTNYIT
jgi:hypothetical protein